MGNSQQTILLMKTSLMTIERNITTIIHNYKVLFTQFIKNTINEQQTINSLSLYEIIQEQLKSENLYEITQNHIIKHSANI